MTSHSAWFTATAWVGCYTDETGADGLVELVGEPGALAVRHRATLCSPSWIDSVDGVTLALTEGAESVLSVLEPRGVVSAVPTGGADGCHFAVSPDRAWLAVAHYSSGSVALLAHPGDDGHLAEPVQVLTFTGHSGVHPDRQERPHAHQAVWLDATTLLVPDLGADRVRVLTVTDGHLAETSAIETPPGFGPRHLVLREQGTELAVGGELSGQVVSYRATDNGWQQGSVVDGSRRGGAQPSGLRVTDHGSTLVLANRGTNTIALLTWAPDGTLSLGDEFDCGGEHPRDVAVHEGRVWVANQLSDSVTVFEPGPDGWTQVDSVEVRTPASLQFSTGQQGVHA